MTSILVAEQIQNIIDGLLEQIKGNEPCFNGFEAVGDIKPSPNTCFQLGQIYRKAHSVGSARFGNAKNVLSGKGVSDISYYVEDLYDSLRADEVYNTVFPEYKLVEYDDIFINLAPCLFVMNFPCLCIGDIKTKRILTDGEGSSNIRAIVGGDDCFYGIPFMDFAALGEEFLTEEFWLGYVNKPYKTRKNEMVFSLFSLYFSLFKAVRIARKKELSFDNVIVDEDFNRQVQTADKHSSFLFNQWRR